MAINAIQEVAKVIRTMLFDDATVTYDDVERFNAAGWTLDTASSTPPRGSHWIRTEGLILSDGDLVKAWQLAHD